MNDDLLTARQAADLIGCSRRTISQWVAVGRMVPAMKLTGTTGAYLFDRAHVLALKAEAVQS